MKCKFCGKEFKQKGKENFCSKSCAAKFNTNKSKQLSKAIKLKNIENYNLNPKVCKQCGKTIPYEKRHRSFCDSSCAATYNNLHKGHEKQECFCMNCGKEISNKERKYCSNKCQQEYIFKQKVLETDKTQKFSVSNSIDNEIKEVNRRFVKKYLEYKYGHKCAICGNTHWLGEPILLIVDHIDGDIENYNVSNYRLICSNCDATLPTYKARNKGKGKRIYRRLK